MIVTDLDEIELTAYQPRERVEAGVVVSMSSAQRGEWTLQLHTIKGDDVFAEESQAWFDAHKPKVGSMYVRVHSSEGLIMDADAFDMRYERVSDAHTG